jgi:cytochrome c553
MMKKMMTLLTTVSLLSTFSAFTQAGDAEAGKAKAVVCAACHGANGISVVPNYPNLAGQKELYIVDALKAYRGGTRNHAIMSPMAMPLSDDDIANLAAYFSSLPAGG